MKQCPNCGASYKENVLTCPYCGAANQEQVEREHEERIEHIDRQIRGLSHLPRQVVNRWSSKTAKVLAACLAIFLVVGLGWAIVNGIGSYLETKTAPARQQAHLEALAELAEEEDPEGIWDYLRDHDIYGGVYEEYTDLYFASYALGYAKDCREYLSKGGIWPNTLAFTVEEACNGIRKIDENLSTHTYVMGVDEKLKEIRADLVALLTEDLGLTQEEMDQALVLAEEMEDEVDTDKVWAAFQAIGIPAAKRHGITILGEDDALE